MNTTRLDYSKLIHRNEQLIDGYTKRNSFYMQKGNGKAGSYRGNYKGDYSVFRATRQQFRGDTMSMIRETEADEMKCKDCFMYSICNGTCDWDDKPVDANDSADDCPNFDYYPNDD